ncbi:hypothetical protein BDZ90DRAFT_260915 [Jaminaea rosea]|uniref:Uncharacterized protein n=1 Tax=Jaminaea rosea TaxID=1569628 RepID=A0A316USF9_9BASI|nr:hypothetical protein BDZ90DRAFT_260915 [Jaminaea rosea]PWN27261.1 hypothetical protein BDZ90DRAFT_260915 [Jaminaea rosea]
MLALLFLLAAATPLINAYMTVNISIICKFDSIHCVQYVLALTQPVLQPDLSHFDLSSLHLPYHDRTPSMPPKEKLLPPVGNVEIDKPGEFLGADLNPANTIAAFPYRSAGTVRFLCDGDAQLPLQTWRLYFSTVQNGVTTITAGISNQGRGGVSFDDDKGDKDPAAGQSITSTTRGVNVVFECR